MQIDRAVLEPVFLATNLKQGKSYNFQVFYQTWRLLDTEKTGSFRRVPEI
jgi:hypothetical protein